MKAINTSVRWTRVLAIAVLLMGFAAHAASKDLDSDMDTLGGNQDLMDRANAINPNNTTRIVQKRTVDLDNRFELLVSDGIVAGGDPYVNSNDLGAQLEYHIDPHWSLGARYYQISNSLSSEGQHIMNADLAAQAPAPSIDYAKDTYFGTVTFAPFYGKLNFADLLVAQFDVYFVAGYGNVDLQTGATPTYTGGGGLAFWWTQHFSTHLEVRYQGYRASLADGTSEQMNLTVLSLGVGFLF